MNTKNQHDFDFWTKWSDVTPLEQKAIDSTVKARELVIKSVPADVLMAIYVKGSFVRREMNSESDVDMVPIVTQSKFESAVFGVNIPEIYPVMVVPLSLEEFKTNNLATKSGKSIDLRVKPDKFLRMIDEYRLIYGMSLDPNKYVIRTDREFYQEGINILKNGFIPLFLKGEVDFSPLLKEFFWTVEMELASQGIIVPHTFAGIARAAQNDRLVQEALRLRQKSQLNKSVKSGFIKELQKYLAKNRL